MKQGILCILILLLLQACSSQKKLEKDYNLFQKGLDSLSIANTTPMTIQANDILEINFYTQGAIDQAQTELFNLLNKKDEYVVDDKGEIVFPVIGKLIPKGLTTKEFSDLVLDKVKAFVKDPLVIVKIKSVKVIVMGEVRRQGVIDLKPERSNILSLFAEIGGVTELGRKDSILIIRSLDSNKKATFYVDLKDAAIFKSPVYQLKQDDLVYVRATNAYLRQLYMQQKSTELQKLQPILLYTGLITTVLSLYLISRNIFFR